MSGVDNTTCITKLQGVEYEPEVNLMKVPKSRVGRRAFLTMVGAGAASTLLVTPAAASGGLGFTDVGVNKFDGDGDGDIRVYAERVKRAVRFYSDGPTGDYITSGANVEEPNITIGDFKGSSPSKLTYEYYGGSDNGASAPDEVWLRLVEADGTEHEVYRAENDGEPAAEEWRTRNVHKELRGNPDFNQGFNWFEVTSGGSIDGLSEALVEEFENDTRITRLAAGRGTFGGDDDLDIKYRDLRFEGERVSTFSSGKGGGR